MAQDMSCILKKHKTYLDQGNETIPIWTCWNVSIRLCIVGSPPLQKKTCLCWDVRDLGAYFRKRFGHVSSFNTWPPHCRSNSMELEKIRWPWAASREVAAFWWREGESFIKRNANPKYMLKGETLWTNVVWGESLWRIWLANI